MKKRPFSLRYLGNYEILEPLGAGREPICWTPPDHWAVTLLAIGAVGFVLRFVGLGWGLPYSMHPDESLILDIAQRLSFTDLRPGFYNYPGFFVYQLMVMVKLVAAWGGDNAQLILAARVFTALYGWATIWIVYLLGVRLAGRSTGVIAAALFAVTGVATLHSHYAVTDTPMTALAIATVWLTVRAGQRLSYREMAFAAVVAGLAVSTKYSAAPVALIPGFGFLALAARGRLSMRRRAAGFVAMGAIAVAAFLITSPYTLLDFDAFRTDMNVEQSLQETGRSGNHVAPLVDASWSERAVVTNFVVILGDLGIPAVLLALFCLVAVLRGPRGALRAVSGGVGSRGSPESEPVAGELGSEEVALADGTQGASQPLWDGLGGALAAAWILLYQVLMATSARGGQRYALPVYPVLMVFVAGGILLFVRSATGGSTADPAQDPALTTTPARSARAMLALLVVLAGAQPAWDAVTTTRLLRIPDTRLVAHDWSLENLPPSSVVAREYYAPLFHTSDGFRIIQPFTLTERSLKAYCVAGTEYLILSSLNAKRYFEDETERFADERAWYEELERGTRVAATFSGPEMELHHPTIEVRRLYCGDG